MTDEEIARRVADTIGSIEGVPGDWIWESAFGAHIPVWVEFARDLLRDAQAEEDKKARAGRGAVISAGCKKDD